MVQTPPPRECGSISIACLIGCTVESRYAKTETAFLLLQVCLWVALTMRVKSRTDACACAPATWMSLIQIRTRPITAPPTVCFDHIPLHSAELHRLLNPSTATSLGISLQEHASSVSSTHTRTSTLARKHSEERDTHVRFRRTRPPQPARRQPSRKRLSRGPVPAANRCTLPHSRRR